MRDRLLRACPQEQPDDSPGILSSLATRLGGVIADAIAARLDPDGKRRSEEVLAARSRAALELWDQAFNYLVDRWLDDYCAHPTDTAATRCQRVIPSLRTLPNMRGRSALGEHVQLWYLAVYHEARDKLARLPNASRVASAKSARKRRALLDELFEWLPEGSRDPKSPFHPVSGNLCFEASDEDLERWAVHSSRHEIALEIAEKVLEPILGLNKTYLRRLLPGLRRKAERMDRALALSKHPTPGTITKH